MNRWFLLALAVNCARLGAQVPDWTQKRPLPRPTGGAAIGTQAFTMSDTVAFRDGVRLGRRTMVQVWYPARTAGNGPVASYLADSALLAAMIREKYLDQTAQDLREWTGLRLAARTGVPPAVPPSRKGWPAIVLSHGFGVSRLNYTVIAQELASRGYVVLAMDHPYGGFMLSPDGQVLQPGDDSLRLRLGSSTGRAPVDSALAWDARRWAQEAAAAVKRLAGRKTGTPVLDAVLIDTLRVGMLGHSLGGAAALQACRDYPIFIACADMDGEPVGDVERDGVSKPILVLLSEPGKSNTEPKDSADRAGRADRARMRQERDSTLKAIVERHPDIPAFVVNIRGTAHFSFSDAPFLMPSLLQGTGSTLSAERAQAFIISSLTDFFDHFLRGAPLRYLHSGATSLP